MATKAGLFNAALTELGHVNLVDTGEPVEAGRVLNEIYDQVVLDCLASGPWNFAAVNHYPTADTGLVSPFQVGYNYGYAKPTTWVRTIHVSDDQYMVFPLLDYFDDQEIWGADTGEIFVRYVSSDTGYGLDLAKWPHNFRRYVELVLAERACVRLTQDHDLRKDLFTLYGEAYKKALAQNVSDSPRPRLAPSSTWQSLYQTVVADLGDQELLSTRSSEARRAIDDVYANVLNECLASAPWDFATRTAELTLVSNDTGVRADTGYAYGVAGSPVVQRTVNIR